MEWRAFSAKYAITRIPTCCVNKVLPCVYFCIKGGRFIKLNIFQPNHLIGLKQHYLKLTFPSVHELTKVKQTILASVRKNRKRDKNNTFYTEMLTSALMNKGDAGATRKVSDHMDNILDIR